MFQPAPANTLYFSELLPAAAPQLWQQLTAALDEYAVPYHLLSLTRDIWCVDYMPVQISRTEFVQFCYEPSYLYPKKYVGKRTDAAPVMATLPLPAATKHPLRLDGGNVVRVGEKVLVTDRVFAENPTIPPAQLRRQLAEALRTELVIIPADPHDFTGHADGLIAALDAQTVLVNDYQGKEAALGRQLTSTLTNAGLTCIPYPYFPPASGSYSAATGAYINFVRIGPLVLLPVFDQPADEAAIYQTEQLFRGCRVVPVRATELAPQGGLLHCVTWAVDQPGATSLPTTAVGITSPSFHTSSLTQYPLAIDLTRPGQPLDRRDRYRGSLLGLAGGDALAAQPAPAAVPVQATAVTQLAIFTAEGLLRAEHRAMLKGIGGAEPQLVWESWLRWLHTQGVARRPPSHDAEEWPSGWLGQQAQLQHVRQPAPTTWQTLTTAPLHPPKPAANTSLGADPLARVVPIGLFHFHHPSYAGQQAARVAAFTHGHPVAQAAAGWVAATVAWLVQGVALAEAARLAYHLLPAATKAGAVCRHSLDLAVQLHTKETTQLAADCREFMRQRTAPAVLLTACYHALHFASQPATALAAASQAGGRVAAALTGALLGAQLGEAAWPADWRGTLDLADLTLTMADDLAVRVKGDTFNPDAQWWARYPGY